MSEHNRNRIEGDTAVNIGGRDGAAGLWRDRQCAAFLGVTTRHLAALRAERKGPPWVKLPGGRWGYQVRYDPAAVRAWVAEQTVPGEAVAANS